MTCRHALPILLFVILLTGCTGVHKVAGEWRSVEIDGGLQHEITRMYLDLDRRGTFVAQFEGPDATTPITGSFTIDGNTIQLDHQEFENTSMRVVDDSIRWAIGGSVVVLQRPPTSPEEES